MIHVKNVFKEYLQNKKRSGVLGLFKDLFSTEKRVIKAVTNISFDISQGEIVGYIGPNGAGKSTTIKMLAGILTPTAGEILIDNVTPFKDRKRFFKKIGVMFGQKSQLWWDLAVIESYNLLAMIYDVDPKDYQERLKIIYEYLGIEPLMHLPVRKLSLGQRVICDLAAIFIHNPKVVFLDEPTIGLDVSVKHKIQMFIKLMNEKYSTTFILTTHDLSEIEKLCERVFLIDEGVIIFSGTVDDMKDYFCQEKGHIIVEFKNEVPQDQVNKLSNFFEQSVQIKPNKYRFIYNKETEELGKLISKMNVCGDLKDIQVLSNNIEEIIREFYEKKGVEKIV